ncbi:MAG: DUF5694 domain-containing protein [Bacteroidota bacterium]
MKTFKLCVRNPLGVILILMLVIISCSKPKEIEPEILLVGTFHKIADSLKCNWKSTYHKILNYRPDQIAVEYNKPLDSSSHIFTLGKNWNTKLDSLKLVWDKQKSSSEDTTKKYGEIPLAEVNMETHLTLWKYYYLHADMGNRDYQSYLIHSKSEDYITSLDTLKDFDSFFQKRHKRIVRHRKDSEFFNLIFPLVHHLGISYIAPTDNKTTYAMQSEAYSKWSKEIKDTAARKKYDSFWKEFSDEYTAKLPECNALEFVNSVSFLKKSDYGQAHIFDDLNNENFKEYSDIWYKRNRLIGDNIIEVIESKDAKRVAVFYGFMHVYPVKKYLEEQGYKVKLLEHLD